MHSRFKFLTCVDPKQKTENTPTKARFSKLTLRKINPVDQTKEIVPQTKEAVREICGTKNMDEENVDILPSKEPESLPNENKNTGQKPKLLLYESTIDSSSKHSEQNSSIITDDDTDSVGSSVDTDFFINALADGKPSQPAQKVNEIESQLGTLSISTPNSKTPLNRNRNRPAEVSNLSQKFNELDLITETDEFKAFEREVKKNSFLDCSPITLSSRASLPDRRSESERDKSETQLTNEVIVLSDTSSDEEQDMQQAIQKPNEEHFYNVTPAPVSNGKLSSLAMQRINKFFDNVPDSQSHESINATVSSADLSKRNSIYVSETSIEESETLSNKCEVNKSKEECASEETSTHFETPANGNTVNENQQSTGNREKPDTATKCTPLKPISNAISSKQSPGNTPNVVKRSGSSVQMTSTHSGQINISAVININIKISERSSSRESIIKVSSSRAPSETPELEADTDNNENLPPSEKVPTTNDILSSKNAKSPVNTVIDSDSSPPRSMGKVTPEDVENENPEDEGSFKVDKDINVDVSQQKLLHKLYGAAWKTPEVLRSFKKDGKNDLNAKQFKPPASRMSKGFHLFKRNIDNDLDSTRIDEISIIENTEISVIQKVEINQKCRQPTKPNINADPKNSLAIVKRSTRKAATKCIQTIQKTNELTDDESFSENEAEDSDWHGKSSISESESESDNQSVESAKSKPRSTKKTSSRAVRKKPTGNSSQQRDKKEDDKLMYLDLSANEVVQVDENHTHNASEQDLAEITRRFLGEESSQDHNDDSAEKKDEFKKPKPARRKLFTHQYMDDDSMTQMTIQNTSENKIRGTNSLNSEVKINIPPFMFPPRKLLQTATTSTTPLSKNLPQPMLDAVTKSLNVKPKGLYNRILTNANLNVKSTNTNRPDIFVTPVRIHGFLKSLDVCVSDTLCHPDALIYRTNFKTTKEELTKLLYGLYNDRVFENKLNVPITWNKKLISTAGTCHCNQKATTGRQARIELSEKVVTSADRLRCTLIHELCHAATWVFEGYSGHGPMWKKWASRANRVFPELPEIKTCHNYDIEYKYTYKCDICHSKSHAHSKSKKVENIRCSYCHGSISIFINKKLKDGKIVQTPVRQASGFAKFVKEKYKEFKVPGKTHAEIMRLISENFAALSVEDKKKY